MRRDRALSALLPEPLALRLYRRITMLSGPLTDILLRRRLLQGKEDIDRITERRGHASQARPDGVLMWIHGASVGESLSVLPLIEHMIAARPDLRFLVTTGTLTSAQLMAQRLPAQAVHQFVPLDNPVYWARFFDHWRPDLAVVVESEFWPNLILNAKKRGVPLFLANARLSESSFKGWRRAQKSISHLLAAFTQVFAQDERSAERLRLLGAANVSIPGNLKDDAAALPFDDVHFNNLKNQFQNRPRWLAASTHETEEAMAGRVHLALRKTMPDVLTLIAPRHPARGDALAKELRTAGLTVAQRSQNEDVQAGTDIYLVDTLGEMGLMYRLAPIVFVGGSFVDVGGHNPLEPARLNCALLFGPHMYNFDGSSASLLDGDGAIQVTLESDLIAQLARLLGDPSDCQALADRANEVASRSSGVAARIGDLLLAALPPAKAANSTIQGAENEKP